MRKVQLIFFFILLTGILNYITAQVTIGSAVEPEEGALLDLKQYVPDANNNTSALGLAMPRVNLTDLDDITKDISEVTDVNKDDHIGLVVYNVNECLTDSQGDTHGKGIYVWDGSKWQYLGADTSSSEVHQLTDSRDQQVYLYRNFGSEAGDWMLENMRYIPKAADGYNDFEHSLQAAGTEEKEKYYCYPVNGTYTIGSEPPEDWLPKEGLLYNWYAATNNENTATTDQAGIDHANIRGICPTGWHVPSDYEWTLLEKEIYNNPQKYSSYTGASQFDPTSWDNDWAIPTSAEFRGSTNGEGHAKAMKALCPLPGGTDYSDPVGLGTSYGPQQGGFSALLTGYNEKGNNAAFYQGAYFLSSSHYSNNSSTDPEIGFWYRSLEYLTDVYAIYSAQIRYHHAANSLFFSVRCKKD